MHYRLFIFFCAALLGAAAGAAERATSDPYTGDLAIFEGRGREAKLKPQRILDLLNVKRGSRVADIGAGSGWFTVRAAKRVGRRGVVYAVEINPRYIQHITRRAKREKLPQIRTVLGKEDNPLLPTDDVDAVLLLKTYHEIAKPVPLLRHVRAAMKRDGLLGIIDRGGIGTDHGLNADVVIKEAAEAGFELVAQHDFVKSDEVDYFLVFRIAD